MKIIAPFCLDDWFKVDFWKTEVLNVFLIMFSGISQLEILGLLMYALRHSGVFYAGSNCYGKQQQARINCVAGVVCHCLKYFKLVLIQLQNTDFSEIGQISPPQ